MKLCKLKHRKDPEKRKNGVHAIECETCRVHYIGRQVNIFVREGSNSREMSEKKWTSGIYEHLKNNKGHSVNWAKLKYLDKENNWKGRKIKEAIYINALNPSNKMAPQKVMNLEKDFELDPLWSEFNAEFRTYASKIGIVSLSVIFFMLLFFVM